MKKAIVLILLLFVAVACTYNKLDEITPNKQNNIASCDTLSKASYSLHIQPILSKYCRACHTGSSSGGGIRLDNYEAVKNNAQSGKFLNSVAWTGSTIKMPKDGDKLSDCNIALIKNWIQNNYAQ